MLMFGLVAINTKIRIICILTSMVCDCLGLTIDFLYVHFVYVLEASVLSIHDDPELEGSIASFKCNNSARDHWLNIRCCVWRRKQDGDADSVHRLNKMRWNIIEK
jgi:hypothetical protein